MSNDDDQQRQKAIVFNKPNGFYDTKPSSQHTVLIQHNGHLREFLRVSFSLRRVCDISKATFRVAGEQPLDNEHVI